MSRKKSRSRKTNTSKQTVKPAVRQSGAIPFQLNAEQRELAANIKEEASESKQVTEEIIPELVIGEPEGKRKSDADDLIIEDVITKPAEEPAIAKEAANAEAPAIAEEPEVTKEASDTAQPAIASETADTEAPTITAASLWAKARSVKAQNIYLIILICIIALTAVTTCVREYQEEQAREPVISFEKQKIKLKTGESAELKVLKEEKEKDMPELTFRSNNKKVATVNKKGVVKAVKAGKATITATSPQEQQIKIKVAVKNPSMKKVIYLTYDDGPGSKVTPKLLKVLKKYNAKATFFVIGTYAKDNTKLLKREIREGHMVEIHTYTHDYEKIYKNSDAYIADFNKTEKVILKATGVQPTYWRFPGGATNSYMSRKTRAKILKKLHKRGYTEMDWTALTNDAVGINYSKKELIRMGIKSIKAAEIPVVLMHDSNAKTKTPEVTEEIIKYFSKRGYRFCSLADYYGGELSLVW